LIYYCLLLLVKVLGRSLQAAMVVQPQKVQQAALSLPNVATAVPILCIVANV
jgi:hypothetical protein